MQNYSPKPIHWFIAFALIFSLALPTSQILLLMAGTFIAIVIAIIIVKIIDHDL